MNRKLAAWMLLAAGATSAQDARQMVEESQRRARANSERYEGELQ